MSSKQTITLVRSVGQKTNSDTIKEQVEYIVDRGLTGNRGKDWRSKISCVRDPFQKKGLWHFTYQVVFTKQSGRGDADQQWNAILEVVTAVCANAKFNKYPWRVVDGPLSGEMDKLEAIIAGNLPAAASADDDDSGDEPEVVQTLEELEGKIAEGLLHDHGAIGKSKFFSHLYGLDPQIRTLLSAVQTFIHTGGNQRDHAVCWGHAGCGKTTTLLALDKLLGPGAVLRLDATSTSRAGIEELFFDKYKDRDYPPIVYCEEVEKADEGGLKVWLGALDDRGELRKNKFRRQDVRAIKVLFICTVNNKRKFDMMMGSDGTEAGALSSRCVTEIYFPRPNRDTLRRILKDRIKQSGGDERWIEPALDLGTTLGFSDPRKFRSLLAGGDRLLTGDYQKDRLLIAKIEQDDHAQKPATLNLADLDMH